MVPLETDAQIDRMLQAAVADAVRSKPAFTRYDLVRMISRHLPADMGGGDGHQVTAVLEQLADKALAPGGPCQVIQLTAPELIPAPEKFRRRDGVSVWHRRGAEVYTTRRQLDTEARLLRAAAQRGAPNLASDRAAAAVGANRAEIEEALWREYGPRGAGRDTADAREGAGEQLSRAGLTDDQALAVYGILTSGRVIDILIGPAGTGKTRSVAILADRWRQAGLGRVIGLTTSTNAARVLAVEGLTQSHNLADFLGKIKDSDATRGHSRSGPTTCWWSTRRPWCPPAIWPRSSRSPPAAGRRSCSPATPPSCRRRRRAGRCGCSPPSTAATSSVPSTDSGTPGKPTPLYGSGTAIPAPWASTSSGAASWTEPASR